MAACTSDQQVDLAATGPESSAAPASAAPSGESPATSDTSPTPPMATTAPAPTTTAPASPAPDAARAVTSTPVSDRAFVETFDGAPASPQPWKPADWDVTVHSRDLSTFDELEPMEAQHGPDCSAPPNTHHVMAYPDAVFSCKDHVMTSINAGGYGLIYLTPDHQVDFGGGTATIRFDLSTARTSQRDWVDVWITPFAENLQLAFDDTDPDLQGPPRRAVHVFLASGEDRFRGEVYDDFTKTEITTDSATTYDSVLTPDAARRDTFELQLSRTHVRFGMPKYGVWWVDADIPPLGWSAGVVQFGHHSYNPTKDCTDCGPNTWHWDNVVIDPSIPFTIDGSDRREVKPKVEPADVTFAAPAPADAFLRFAGIGNDLGVSFDGGVTWTSATPQQQVGNVEEHFKSYWMPVPAGTRTVTFRGADWWGGPPVIRDASIWSPDR
jgi:hypothetical protein